MKLNLKPAYKEVKFIMVEEVFHFLRSRLEVLQSFHLSCSYEFSYIYLTAHIS